MLCFHRGGGVVDPSDRKRKDPKSWIDQATELKAFDSETRVAGIPNYSGVGR